MPWFYNDNHSSDVAFQNSPSTSMQPNQTSRSNAVEFSFYWKARYHIAKIFAMASWSMSMIYDLHCESFQSGNPSGDQLLSLLRKNTSSYTNRGGIRRLYTTLSNKISACSIWRKTHKEYAQRPARASKLLYQGNNSPSSMRATIYLSSSRQRAGILYFIKCRNIFGRDIIYL